MYKCNYCDTEFEKYQSKGGHVVNCNQNPKYNDIKNVKIITLLNGIKRKFDNIHGKLIFKDKICNECGKDFLIKEFEYDNKDKYYCNRSCANRRSHSKYTKQKISESLLGREYTEREYRKCVVCNLKFRIIKTNTKQTCGNKKCVNELISRNLKGKTGGYRTKSGRSKFHGGYYNDIWMDSSWEIRLAKKLDENNIIWDRGSKYYFNYLTVNKESRKYYPDFYLPNQDLFVEVKGYWTTEVRHKIKSSLERNNFNLLILESLNEIDNVKNLIKAKG